MLARGTQKQNACDADGERNASAIRGDEVTQDSWLFRIYFATVATREGARQEKKERVNKERHAGRTKGREKKDLRNRAYIIYHGQYN